MSMLSQPHCEMDSLNLFQCGLLFCHDREYERENLHPADKGESQTESHHAAQVGDEGRHCHHLGVE